MVHGEFVNGLEIKLREREWALDKEKDRQREIESGRERGLKQIRQLKSSFKETNCVLWTRKQATKLFWMPTGIVLIKLNCFIK